MPRNLHTSALIRACRQVPNWYKWGGRQSPYAIEWIQQGSGTEYYTILNPTIYGGLVPPDFTLTLWFKVTGSLLATRYGLLGFYDSSIAVDWLSLVIDGNANTLEVRGLGGLIVTGGIQSGWNNATVVETGGSLELHINGVLHGTGAGTHGGPIDAISLGATHFVGSVPPVTYLDKCIVDEIAFFTGPQDPVVLYNNGIPAQYENGYPDLEVSYEVEKSVGAIHNKAIPPTFTRTGYTAPSFDWYSVGVNTITQVTTTGLRSKDTNPLVQMADNYGDYGRGVASSTRDNRTPLGSGNSVESLANGLMPFPAGGGFETMGYANAFVGNVDEPNLSPQVSKAITMSTGDSTDYDAIGGPLTLSGVTDARSGKLFPPTFVKKP